MPCPAWMYVLSFLSTNVLVAPIFKIGNFLNYWSWVPSLYSEEPVPDFDPFEGWLLWKLLDDALERPHHGN